LPSLLSSSLHVAMIRVRRVLVAQQLVVLVRAAQLLQRVEHQALVERALVEPAEQRRLVPAVQAAAFDLTSIRK
jgi:hypothetical protein